MPLPGPQRAALELAGETGLSCLTWPWPLQMVSVRSVLTVSVCLAHAVSVTAWQALLISPSPLSVYLSVRPSSDRLAG